MTADYDEISALYDVIYDDWDASIERQSSQLANMLETHWQLAPGATVLDAACGIGTQAIGLAQVGFAVIGSDLSARAVERARLEASARGVDLDVSVCDMRQVHVHHHRQFDAVICCDNSVPHLLSDDEILLAFRGFFQCTAPGGGCIVTVRDYDREERGTGLVRLYGTRDRPNGRYLVFQVWDFEGDIYDLSMYFVFDPKDNQPPQTRVLRTKYYAVGTARLWELMEAAGFAHVRRIDGEFFQPALVGTRPA